MSLMKLNAAVGKNKITQMRIITQIYGKISFFVFFSEM